MLRFGLIASFGLALAGCEQLAPVSQPDAVVDTVADVITPLVPADGLIPYERFQLDNGLTVLFHIDRSDPVVAVSLTAHVGSAREKPGRTGFAHLFEHLLFLESENLGKGGLDQLSARIGGSGANGSTSRDRTNYLQTVPNDALEKMLWAEADKLGWFINTVTEPVLAKEKEVVKNEKRQGVDNRPYGHTFYVLHKALYPEDHPYNWQVIGSLEDLQAAELQDVKDFFNDWYTPNNVTLVVAGDFDTTEAKAWVERYFAEIPRGPDVAPLTKRPGAVAETVRLFHEDNFADLPELTAAWPTVPSYHPDSYALDVLAELLAVGKEAPLNEVLIDEEKLTAGVSAFPLASELAGEFILQVRAFDGTDLDTVRDALHSGFARFEADGISAEALERVKVRQEVAFYSALGSVLGKGVQLARCELFAGDAGCIDDDLARLQAVTAADVMRVYETYIKGQPHVVTSFVPKGAPELALEGSVRAEVVEEAIVPGAEGDVDPNVEASYEPTPSEIDRSVEPPYGPLPQAKTPDIWRAELANGVQVYGIEDRELPLVRFELVVDGGAYFMDTVETAGTANLVAEVLTRGTANKTPAELENALALLGADISASAGLDSFTLSGRTLARNFDATMALLEQILFEPRWDEAEFELAKARVSDGLKNSATDPNVLAFRALNLVTYGEESRRAYPVAGGVSQVEAITLDDLKAWHEGYLAPNRASLRVVGAVTPDDVEATLDGFAEHWEPRAFIAIAENPTPPVTESKVYFYDIPGAKQTVFAFGRPALTRTDPNFDAADIMNYRLGGGGFASRLTQELREGKGYTYGIFSDFDGTDRVGNFSVFTPVRANVTLEAAVLIKNIMLNYAGTYTEDDLEVTKSFITKSQARSVESLGAKLGVLGNIADYDLPEDYLARRVATAQAMTVDDVREITRDHIRPGAMNYIFVGDAESQLSRLSALGFGEPVLINDAVDALIE